MHRDSKTPRSAAATEPAFMRMASVVRFTGLGKTTIYRMVDEQCFPQPVRLGPRAVAWRRADVERWSDERPSVSG